MPQNKIQAATYSKHVSSSFHLAGFLTVGVKGHLLGGQLASRVDVVAEVDLAVRPAPQELPLLPVDWRPRGCRNKTPR